MSRIRLEYLDPETSDRSVAADVLVRQEPDEEEDEEEDEDNGKEDGDEDEEDDGWLLGVRVGCASTSHSETAVEENRIGT